MFDAGRDRAITPLLFFRTEGEVRSALPESLLVCVRHPEQRPQHEGDDRAHGNANKRQLWRAHHVDPLRCDVGQVEQGKPGDDAPRRGGYNHRKLGMVTIRVYGSLSERVIDGQINQD